MFNNVSDAINWIENIKRFAKRADLSRITKASSMLGNPQNAYKTIHVAGTNGKGSTTTFITDILLNAGYKVGKYVSPYVVIFNERISVNNEYISNDDLIRYANIIYDLNKSFLVNNDTLTFFEVITLIAFLYFKDMNVDYAVIEVGMGGVIDATNIINSEIQVITNIGLDHMNTLGNSLEEIALNKLGIVKNNGFLVTTVSDNLYPIFTSYLDSKNASGIFISPRFYQDISDDHVSFIYKNRQYDLSMVASYQIKNAVLAIEVINNLLPNISYEIIYKALKNAFWPGRFEVISKNPMIILDGAHNPHGMEALLESIKKYPKVNTMFCVMHDKDYSDMIKMLDSFSTRIVFTSIDYHRAEKSDVLLELSSLENKINIPSLEEALDYSIKNTKDDEVLLITGSLYLISRVRKILNK